MSSSKMAMSAKQSIVARSERSSFPFDMAPGEGRQDAVGDGEKHRQYPQGSQQRAQGITIPDPQNHRRRQRESRERGPLFFQAEPHERGETQRPDRGREDDGQAGPRADYHKAQRVALESAPKAVGVKADV